MIRTMSFLLCIAFMQAVAAQDTTAWESQVRAFEEKDLTAPPPKGETVAVGSSSIRLWSTIKTDLLPEIVIPRGIGGATTSDVLYYLDRIVLVYEPRRILIYAGENDISGSRTPQQVLETIKVIVKRIHAALPNARVYLLSIKPSILRWGEWPAMQSANELMASYADTDVRIDYVDVSTPLLGADGLPVRAYYLDDLLHLSKEGYILWTDAIRQSLAQNMATGALCSTIGSTPWGTFGARQRRCGFTHSNYW